MTCIIGLVEKGKVYIGGDSAGVDGLDVTVRKDPKVFINGDFIMGYTSSFRMGQILRFHKFEARLEDDVRTDYEYMVTDFVNEIREAFKDGGYAKVSENVDKGGIFLVGYRGKLFMIEKDFQVGERFDNFVSVGCGYAYALGYLLKDPSSKNIEGTLKCAERFSGGVRRPFLILLK